METIEHSVRLFDMHCHLDFVNDIEAVCRCLDESGIRALSCTVSPADYLQCMESHLSAVGCTVALGLHPWQAVTDAVGEEELTRFEELATTTRFIGEVGLDHAGGRDGSAMRELQRHAFSRVLAACDAPSAFPRKLLSLHAVRAASDVLDMLEAHDALPRHDCIFHWFAGTSEELKRAIDAGCYFSVGPRMLATKRGREYARVIPADRLLLETDSPAAPGEPWSCADWAASLEEALSAIAELRHVSEGDLARTIARTSESLLRPA